MTEKKVTLFERFSRPNIYAPLSGAELDTLFYKAKKGEELAIELEAGNAVTAYYSSICNRIMEILGERRR